MTTGERIKARRKALGMNAETLAERIGVSATTIYRYENGDISKVSTEVLKAIAEVLLTTPAALMGFNDMETGDDDLWKLRESMRQNPDLRILFDAAWNATPEDLQEAAELLNARRTIRNITNRK